MLVNETDFPLEMPAAPVVIGHIESTANETDYEYYND
jgi:hypothetical protein